MAGLAQDVEYEISQIVRSLPAKSVVEVRDFAQFLAYKETTLSRSETALTDWDMQAAAIDQEQRAFESQHNELLKQYSGRYIAMIGGQVVDDDLDRLTLRRRIRQQYDDSPVLITSVEEEPTQTVRVRSPRLVAEVS
ncbi:MAG: hypothetical protein KDH08_07990 [Anaerolineae bacterium]|nr:hypothetical protein [Anaerolineae bacterium]MCB9133405.1 hypothetical protein [Anaerolineales bacterium]MCO5243461.1 DUF5678 domain-containing protein [Anaerolineae bacterium]HRX01683.1 DUF5678 domain-containing protein [Anaerolineae bacterium]